MNSCSSPRSGRSSRASWSTSARTAAWGCCWSTSRPLARIERSFGATAYKTLRSQVDPLLAETKAHVRDDDVLTRDERDADRYLFFLTGKRKTKNPFAAVDLQRLCDRVESFVTRAWPA